MALKHQITLSGHEGAVLNVRWTPNGAYAMSTGADSSIRLWNPSSGALVRVFSAHSREALDVAIRADNGSFVSCGTDREALLWDVETGAVVRRLRGHTHRINSVAMSSEGTLAFSGSYDATVRVWDLRSRSESPLQTMGEPRDSVTCVLSAGAELLCGSVDGCVRHYSFSEGALRVDHIARPVTHIALSRDSNCLLVSTLDSKLRLFLRTTGEMLAEYTGHANTSARISADFSADDARVFSGSEDGVVYCWELVEGVCVQKLRGHRRAVTAVAHHPMSPALLSASVDGDIRVWAADP
eukprot:Amastigsp_a339831_316.p1 type:complete len:297 gc:universal Amastigsp_a339831_316:120-1010(+)